MDSDFTLALLISALPKRPNLKLVLMSATIQTEKFTRYLGEKLGNPGDFAPILSIPGRTFPVSEYFKGDFEMYVKNDPNRLFTGADKGDLAGQQAQLFWDTIVPFDQQIGGRKYPDDLMNYELTVRTVLRLVWAPVEKTGRNIYVVINEVKI